MVYDSVADMQNDKNLKVIRKEISQTKGAILFDPDLYKKDLELFQIATNPLDEEQLIEYGRIASDIRRQVTIKADQIAPIVIENSGLDEESKDSAP